MNHSKAVTLRIGYLRRRLTQVQYKYNASYKAVVQGEIKIIQTNGIIFLDKMFKKLHKLGYVYNEKKLSSEGLYHVWGERSGKKIFGVLDPGGEAMMMMPVKRIVTHIGIPNGKTYMNTDDTFLVALMHPDDGATF
jgi:hypothetical protein